MREGHKVEEGEGVWGERWWGESQERAETDS